MYKIGEFAKLTNLSVKTLRYYNEIGLLIPEEVDVYNNYRYYGERNLKETLIINKLKKAGFSLDEIINNWGNFTDDVYLKKKNQLFKEMEDVESKIKLIDDLRYELNKNNVKVKSIGE